MKKILFLVFNLLIVFKSIGQNELTFPFMENVLQSSYINPAHVPEHKLSIGLPGISSIQGAITNTGFTYRDLVRRKNADTVKMDFKNMISKLKQENYLYTGFSTDLFSVRVKVRHFFWSFNITEKFTSRISYPKDLLKVAYYGNGDFIGSKIDLAHMGLNITHYREYAVGIVKQERKFVFGARVKYYQGLGNIYFKPKNFGLTTAADMYALQLTTDATVNTSGIPDSSFDAKKYMTNFKNPGAGIDLGITYKLSRKFIASAAINNLGFISWKSNVNNYSVRGGHEFAGANLGKDLLESKNYNNKNFAEDEAKKYLDSLKRDFEYKETKNKYKTLMIPQLYLTLKYIIGPKTQAAASLYLEKFIVIRPALTFAIYQEVGRTVNLVGSYSIQYGKFNNFGLGVVIKPPATPFQFYFAGDNLFNKYTILNDNKMPLPLSAKTFNFRTGINLVFGAIKLHDKQSIPGK